jgi:TPR repeat protein
MITSIRSKSGCAVVLLGVMHLMGWTVPKDGNRACRYFSDEYRSGDPWAAYFLDRCYREGLGGRVNLTFAGQIETSALLSDNAQTMLALIDSDDLEKQRQKELDALLSDPAIFKACSPMTASEIDEQRIHGIKPGHCTDYVNQALLNQKAKKINDRYNAIQ